MSRFQEFYAILRSLRLISEASLKIQESEFKVIWNNSSVRTLIEDLLKNNPTNLQRKENAQEALKLLTESGERFSTVLSSIRIYMSHQGSLKESELESTQKTVKGLEKQVSKKPIIIKSEVPKPKPIQQIKLTPSDIELLKKLDMEHREKLKKQEETNLESKKINDDIVASFDKSEDVEEIGKIVVDKNVNVSKIIASPNPKSLNVMLSSHSKQRSVPSSRIGRMFSYGSLAAGLGLGTVAEYAKRTIGIGDPSSSTVFMTQANLDRISDTLCKVRGAGLKLGQMLSIQDESVVSPELAKALERVRKSADFMPDWQVNNVMQNELGLSWRDNFKQFEQKPFAAASIGQVHLAELKNGEEVAIKIQYPGVAQGINSDIDNLVGIMNMWNIFPKGMFLDNLMAVAKRELAWEVDYVREAECTRKFKELLAPYPDFYVPAVKDKLTTKQVFTTELLDGIPVDQCFDMPEEDRRFISSKILELCLLEILEFRYMQTDPNWANFLYNAERKQILLLDFGASRDYSKEFMDKYVKILKAACDSDRETILNVSRELGFLTGYESKVMEEAHVDAVMILGELFRCEGEYDFSAQDLTHRIQNLVPTMLTHRLCPPPEEIYSLHRKITGVFLLCSKMKVPISCRAKFLDLYNKYVRTNT